MHLATRWFGTFIFDNDKVVHKKLFSKDPEVLSDIILKIQSGEILDEEKELVKGTESKDLIVTEKRLSSLGDYQPSAFDISPEEHGFDNSLLHEALLVSAKDGMAAPGRDRLLIQAVSALEELNKTANLLSERLAEWYGHHSHYLVKDVSAKKLAELVAAFGSAEEIGQNTKLSPSITGEFTVPDMTSVRSLARLLDEIYKERERTEKYVHTIMAEIAPNTAAVAGPVLGARLIAKAGGLEKMANLPASTVQVLGAETALFLHLKEGKKPPKHGIIFQHVLVHDAPHWHRGKISRSLAAKISMAARVDNASGRDVSKDILEQLNKRVEEIRRRYPTPPKKENRGGQDRSKGQGRSGGQRGRTQGKPRGANPGGNHPGGSRSGKPGNQQYKGGRKR